MLKKLLGCVWCAHRTADDHCGNGSHMPDVTSATVESVMKPDAPEESPTTTNHPAEKEAQLGESDVLKAELELSAATERFGRHYQRFLTKHAQFVTLDKEIHLAIQSVTDTSPDLAQSAAVFRNRIAAVLEAKCREEALTMTRWPSKVGRLLAALFPLAKLSVGIASSMADVTNAVLSLMMREAGFCL